jgi:2-polyprenyl-6-methoxyphenol hydroxylase-like FAD-dependent oxidoreductase
MQVIVAGAGIGGLSAALFLHARGVPVRVFEAVAELKEFGVGINLQPHAVAELAKLGLEKRLDRAGNRCLEWGMFNKFGQAIWREPRGVAAGHDWPQISIHRGKLQGILLAAVTERLGRDAVVSGHRLSGFEDGGRKVRARFATRDYPGAETTIECNALIGADGIHSAVRRQLYPDEGDPIFAGATLWRGMTRGKPYLTGATQVFCGHPRQKFIAYPITPPDADGMQMLNWIADVHADAMLNREDWNREGRLADFLPLYEGWRFDWLDVPAVIQGADAVWEFPMVDRDPLPRWSFGRVTLLGDAAHPMYPIGANGGSQAIRDASALADAFAGHADPAAALEAYDGARREIANAIVVSNRRLGPEQALKLADERAPDGFDRIEDVIPQWELEEISRRYRDVTWAKRG